MAHEIDFSNNKPAIAFVGNRSEIWHGLGQELTEDASIEVWKKEAGLQWEIKESDVLFSNRSDEIVKYPDKKVLHRSDTGGELSIVGSDYKVVQPGEVLEFFRDLLPQGMKLSTAGCLFDGRRFWALADTSMYSFPTERDPVKGFLLLTTSCDGTLATTAQFTSVRVVCNNTLSVSLSGTSKSRVRVTHRSTFDPSYIKDQLGILDESWMKFSNDIKKMAEFQISNKDAHSLLFDCIRKPELGIDEQPYTVQKEIDTIMQLSKTGMGAELSKGTLWGIVNGATEYVDWKGYGRNADNKLWSAWFGKGKNLKDEVFSKALELI